VNNLAEPKRPVFLEYSVSFSLFFVHRKFETMLKPSEIRIGNLVTVNSPEFMPQLKDVVLEVTGINQCKPLEGYANTGYSVQLIDRNNYNQTYSQFICFIEPIKCDEERLLDLGFEITYSSNYRLKLDHNKLLKIQ